MCLSRLEEKDILEDPTKPRAIEIVSDQNNDMTREETIYVPVIGKVTAGVPITAENRRILSITRTFNIHTQ